MTHADYIDADLGSTETTETDLGDITLPVTGGTIVAVWGICHINQTTDETTTGFFRIDSTDVSIQPLKFPVQIVQGGTGTVAGGGYAFTPQLIPVNIQIPGKAILNCYMTLTDAQSDGAHGSIGVVWEP